VHDLAGNSMGIAADCWSITLHEQIAATGGVWLQSLVMHPAINPPELQVSEFGTTALDSIPNLATARQCSTPGTVSCWSREAEFSDALSSDVDSEFCAHSRIFTRSRMVHA